MMWIQQIFGQSVSGDRVVCVLVVGYVVGCLTTGYYLGRFRLHMDIREVGSGSVGARNAGRIMGVPGFFFTLLGDFTKGAVVVWAVRRYWDDPRLTALAMLAVVFGHIFPLQLGFRGGKGVATAFGAMAVYDFRLALALFILCGLFSLFGRVTPAGLVAFALLPVLAKMMDRSPLEIIVVSVLAGMILVAHRRNLIEEFSHPAGSPDAHTNPDRPLD